MPSRVLICLREDGVLRCQLLMDSGHRADIRDKADVLADNDQALIDPVRSCRGEKTRRVRNVRMGLIVEEPEI